jgi:hypothetical protein
MHSSKPVQPRDGGKSPLLGSFKLLMNNEIDDVCII